MHNECMAESLPATAKHLQIIRGALGYAGRGKQKEFAEEVLGMDPKVYNNFERGYPLPVMKAQQIKRAVPGVTLEYIYDGDFRGMPFEMVTKLRTFEESASGPNSPKIISRA